MNSTPEPQRYRHRTVEVEAVQWTGSNADALRAFAGPDFDTIDLDDRIEDPDKTAAVREAEHGTWRGLKPGDWVVRLDEGLYEFDATDFAKQYEPAPAAVSVTVPPAQERRDRYAKAIRDTDGWVLDDGQHTLDAVLAVADAEQADTRAAVLREAATIVRSMDSDYALQEAAEHLDGLAVEDDEEREAQAHVDALAPLAEGAPLPALDGPALYEKLVGMFSGPLPWPPDSRADLVTFRERIAEDLYAHDHPGWRVSMVESGVGPVYRARAVAVVAGLRHLAAVLPQPETQAGPEAKPEFTEARAAFMQIGRTPSLEGLRTELRIEGQQPLVGRYCGASMGRMHDVPGHEHLLAVDPRLIFEYADREQPAVVARPEEA